MMSDACEHLDLGERQLRIGPLRVGHLLEIERRVIAERRDPLEALVASWNHFDESQRRELLRTVYEQLLRPPAVELAELVAWMNSPLGTAFAFWLVARDAQPELAWEACRELVLAAPVSTLERIQQALAPELWEQELGNSSGQTRLDEANALGGACFAS